MSSDPLLTSLCGICHTREPKYKCPRCQAKTCSLACVKKHKNWSSCSGERDPTVFVPASQLRTDRGIDHDYNYLHKLERKVEQVDKIFTEERGILPQKTQDSRPNKRARVHKGQSRGRTTLGEGLRPWARASISRLKKLSINVEQMPYGMSRQRENKTSYNQKLRVINWQVEWLLLDPENGVTRYLSKTPETTPLFAAYGECQWHLLSREEKDTEKKEQKARLRDQPGDTQQDLVQHLQNLELATWSQATNLVQDTATGQWNTVPRVVNTRPKEEGIKHEKEKYKFFLGNPRDPAREAKTLVPLAATDTLEIVLTGQTVVEFPQIYVLLATSNVPSGFILKTPPKRSAPKSNDKKRKSDALVAYGTDSESDSDSDPEVEAVSKEDGEVRDDDDDNAEFEFENEEQRQQFLETYHANAAADTTSSSGSDSSDEDME